MRGIRAEYEREARIKAFRAARMANTDGVTQIDAAKAVGIARHLVCDASMILKYGTPEEIESAEKGEAAISQLMRSIRGRVAPDVRQQQRKTNRIGPDRRKENSDIAGIYTTLRGGLEAMTSLPRPQDVVDMMRRNSQRKAVIDQRLVASLTWLTEFSDAWTK